jgi:AraC family transcriptional regulator
MPSWAPFWPAGDSAGRTHATHRRHTNLLYLCGVAVSGFSHVPSDWSLLADRGVEVVFLHREHISTIRSTWTTIWNKWLPDSARELVDAPDFERYGEEFDSHTGMCGLEIWIPIQA